MARHRTLALWIVAAVLAVLTVAAVVVDPAWFRASTTPDELTSTVEKAATYFDFEHYDRAAATYAEAAEKGMESGISWFRYARSVDRSAGLDLELYVTAYRLLLQQSPNHEYLHEAEAVLAEFAVAFSYAEAEEGSLETGTLMVATGIISRVKRGRVRDGVDTIFVDTKPDDWFGYMGERIRIVAPRDSAYQSGVEITAIGWYDGWCEVDDDAGLAIPFPCLIAAGVVPTN